MNEQSSPWIDEANWKARWEAIEKLPGGGQGDAIRARRRLDGKIGFLKIIKSRKDPERRARFFREASAYDSFGVNGVPRLIESNAHRHADPSFSPFIVADFVEGLTLRAWRERQASVSLETAVSITADLLDILHACHNEGCVHRDVKPENIILENCAPERVWLLDFGISYHDLADVDFRTEDWQEVGNRFLRLPELSAGSRLKQDPRSDVCFAAGILFYLLTGEHPDILEDSEGRLPHQRAGALAQLERVASNRLARLLALFDEAFATRLASRFATVRAMQGRIERMMQDTPSDGSLESDLAALREVLDTTANRRLTETIGILGDGLRRVQRIFDDVQQSIGGSLSISQTGWGATGEGGTNTLFWTRPGSKDRILSVTYEVLPIGDELLVRMAGETVYRTDLAQPDYGDAFDRAIRAWVVGRLRIALTDPHALPSEADAFGEVKPLAAISAAVNEAKRRNVPILAFVYDPAQPERSQLRWSLQHFLQNRRTRDIMSNAFVTALVPLSAIRDFSEILDDQSMEQARWLVLDQQLNPLEQAVIYANAQEAERIMGGLADRYGTGDGTKE